MASKLKTQHWKCLMQEFSDFSKKPNISFHYDSHVVRVEIETKNLHIKSYSDSDFENCVALYGNETITKFFDHGKPRSRLEVEQYIQEKSDRFFNNGEPFGLFSIFDKENMAFIGQVDLVPTDEIGVVEIGCILNKKYQNQGLGTEAVRTLLFDYIEELNRSNFKSTAIPVVKIIGTVHPENYLSRGLIKNIGMAFDKFQERFDNPRLWYSLLVQQQKNNKITIDNSSTHIWQAEEYHQHSTVQSEAASELLQHIQFNGSESVLDIGCGDGKITAKIAKHIPNGSALGLDISKEMIEFAQAKFAKDNHPNLTFLLQDAQQLKYDKEFDLVFSSFALQWIPDHHSFLKDVNKSLKPVGYLAATIPLGISVGLGQAIKELTSQARWLPYFLNFSQKWQFPNEKNFTKLLMNNQFEIVHQAVIQQEMIFPSRTAFEKYVLPWFPYFNPLPEHFRELFFTQVIERCLEIEPAYASGEVCFKFPRMDIIAKKLLPDLKISK